MTYLYDPRTNITKETTLETLKGLTGKNLNTLMTYRSKSRKIAEIGAYVTSRAPSLKQRRIWYEKEKYDDEIFLPVEGSEGKFLVSNYGRLKRIYKKSERFCLPYQKKGVGNLFVKAQFLGKQKEHKVGHIVAHHFLGPRPEGKSLVRKNGIITDDYAGNLEYVTRQELGRRTGYKSRGEPIVQLDLETGELINEFRSIREAGRECFISPEAIRNNVLGMSKHSGGFKFMRLSEYEELTG